MKTKKLMKSRNNRILTGVLGGLAEYFGINARYLRIAYLILTVLFIKTLIPVFLYLLMMVLMPNDYGKDSRQFNNSFGNRQSDSSSRGRKILHDVEEKDDLK